MWPFMFVGGVFALATVLSQPRRPNLILWTGAGIFVALFVGLRHHVSVDWNNYLWMIDRAANIQSFEDFMRVAEPGYTLLLLIGNASGGGIYVTNLITAFMFCLGLFLFARRTPEPWIALMVALPFFVVAFSMSANRQAAAVGILLIVIAYWDDWSLRRKVAVILFAALFHSSAVIMLGFVGTALRIPFQLKVFLVGIFALVAIYFLQITGRIDYYDTAYGRGQTAATQSSGALIHVALNAVPAAAYLLWPKKRDILFPNQLLKHMAIAALLTFPLAVLTSAAAGRISLYWYPVSMMVFAALPLTVSPNSRFLVRSGIAILMMLELVVWLMFANSSNAHLPYRNALFTPDWELHIGIVR